MSKAYDRRYFDRWYRAPRERTWRGSQLARRAALAVAVAEHHLERPVRTALDVGCGEGAWRTPLLKLRPRLRYLGFDSSEYAVARYGRTRDLRLARFSDFAALRPCAPADLVICADVLHYLPARELKRGLPGLAALCGGIAYLETFTREDEIEGDFDGFIPRNASWYRRLFADAGFVQSGPHCWLSPVLRGSTTSLETA